MSELDTLRLAERYAEVVDESNGRTEAARDALLASLYRNRVLGQPANLQQVSRLAGVSRQTIYRWLDQHG